MTSLYMLTTGSADLGAFAPFYFQPVLGQAISLGMYCTASAVAVIVAICKHDSFKDVLADKAMLRADPDKTDQPTSFSRLTGLIGTIYLAAFLWALGFFVLTYIWVDPTKIATVIGESGRFLMAGSALFAPYAFNQLSQIFTPPAAPGKSPTSSSTGSTNPSLAQWLTPKD